MLPCEQRGRADNGHLASTHGHDKGRPKRDLGLAKAHIAADQAIHRTARRQIGQDIGNGAELVFRFLIGEPGAELFEQALRRINRFGLVEQACRCDLDQAIGHLTQTHLGAGLASLPGGTAEAVKDDIVAL